jgi:hypothetical protein
MFCQTLLYLGTGSPLELSDKQAEFKHLTQTRQKYSPSLYPAEVCSLPHSKDTLLTSPLGWFIHSVGL